MKRYILIAIILFTCQLSIYAQEIKTDIFGDLEYYNSSDNYIAKFKKDIFDALIFTDNKGNQISYDQQYINSQIDPHLYEENNKRKFFKRLIHQYIQEQNYIATYKVDIFGTVQFHDNKNNSQEIGKDIFGNPTYKETYNGKNYSINTDINGTIIYTFNNDKATLKKDIFEKWNYEDSRGNNASFNPNSFNQLRKRFGKDQDVLLSLVDLFIPNN
jgi:lipid II isoglutaminyl synthase (glutamine-hydrolysing)